MWHATIFTLFPQMFPGPLGYSVVGKALQGHWSFDTVNIRDFAYDKHKTVDDSCFGGGAGMVIRADVLDAAIGSIPYDMRLFYLSPKGHSLTQSMVKELSSIHRIGLICGRYEGIDERILQLRHVEEISVGDFVVSGGEVAALCLIDACVRLLPGVMGNDGSSLEESFERNLLEYPHYTKPRVWNGISVPDVLLSGDHGAIRAWREEQARLLTRERRPDLWKRYLEGNEKY